MFHICHVLNNSKPCFACSQNSDEEEVELRRKRDQNKLSHNNFSCSEHCPLRLQSADFPNYNSPVSFIFPS